MNNFIIRNDADVAEIDIFGDIGEGWFTEGNTIDSVKASLQGISAKDLIINISSLGGDVNHALAIHDMIKMHPAKVTVKITGFTASSGTIVAMAADEVQMSDNALFLVHNAWTGVQGNQHDLREMADELAKVDDRIINIYAKKTGKRKDSIHNLMKEEKWIDASEAKDFGFIDTTFEPIAMAASIGHKINDSDLPTINNILMSKITNGASLASSLNSAIDSMVTDNKSRGDIIDDMASAAGISESTVGQILSGDVNCPPIDRLEGFASVLNVSMKSLEDAAGRDGCEYSVEDKSKSKTMNKVKEGIESILAKLDEVIKGKTEEGINILDTDEVTAMVTEINAKVSESVDSLQTANDTIEAHVATEVTLNATIVTLTAEVAKNSATATTVASVDGNIEGTEQKLNAWSGAAEQFKSQLRK